MQFLIVTVNGKTVSSYNMTHLTITMGLKEKKGLGTLLMCCNFLFIFYTFSSHVEVAKDSGKVLIL